MCTRHRLGAFPKPLLKSEHLEGNQHMMRAVSVVPGLGVLHTLWYEGCLTFQCLQMPQMIIMKHSYNSKEV